MPRRTTIALLLAVVLLAGCGGGENTQATGDEKIEAAEALEATTTTIDPWAVPDPIDAAYVQRVIQELEDVKGSTRYDVWTRHQFDENSKERLRAIYGEPYLSYMFRVASEDSTKEHPNFKKVRDGAKVSVVRLGTIRLDCIFVVVSLDETPFSNEPKTFSYGKTIKPISPNRYNKTGWQQIESVSVDGYPEEDLCAR